MQVIDKVYNKVIRIVVYIVKVDVIKVRCLIVLVNRYVLVENVVNLIRNIDLVFLVKLYIVKIVKVNLENLDHKDKIYLVVYIDINEVQHVCV